MSNELSAQDTRSYIELANVQKTYGNGAETLNILDDLNLNLAQGQVLIVTGESGSGKTTFLNILGGLDSADRGLIRVADTRVSDLKEQQLGEYRRKSLGFIFQFHHLLKDFSAAENIALAARIAGVADPTAQKMAGDLLERMGIGDRAKHFPYQLSGGERQRVAIARALVNDPDLILADEPTGSLDEERSREVEALLFDLVRERGKTMIIVTHDRRLAQLGDRQAVLSRGQLV